MERTKINIRYQYWLWEHKPSQTILRQIEKAGRTCYKSEKKITNESAKSFVKNLIKNGHMSVIEHSFASIRVITSRAVANELVRHRLASFSQESSRYVNYNKKGFEFIYPEWSERKIPYGKSDIYMERINLWEKAMTQSAETYTKLLDLGLKPEDARGVLPLDLKTEIVMSANFREWMHIFKLRLSKYAHPQMKELMMSMLSAFQEAVPVIFDDI